MHRFHQSDLAQRIREASRGSPLLYGTARDFPKTRWQRLRSLSAWLKRDDELSFTMSGPKFRKLCGLSQLIADQTELVSYGSSRSAFLLGLAQLCQSQGQSLELFLLKSTPWRDKGTDALYRSVFEEHAVTWVEREEWGRVESLLPRDKRVIPEGGVSEAALFGAMSLGLDIVEQMEDLQQSLEHIWIDAGSGLTAQALIQSLGGLLENPPHVHVVLCAGNEDDFRAGLSRVAGPSAPYSFHRPPTARAYGSTNREIWQTIERYLKTEGVLLDPIYTAKLMLAFEKYGQANSLIVHSGGGLNNFGFEDFLTRNSEGRKEIGPSRDKSGRPRGD